MYLDEPGQSDALRLVIASCLLQNAGENIVVLGHG
jgi:hypothetical protein